MAVTILNQPTSPNAANAKLLFSVSSSNINEPQFSYVCDIYESGSSEILSRVHQIPNPAGTATFSIGSIVKDSLGYAQYQKLELSTNAPTGSSTTPTVDTVTGINLPDYTGSKQFDFKFGEAYGTSISSSVTYYTDLASSSLVILPAVWDANNPQDQAIIGDYTLNYNWPSGSFTVTTGGGNFRDHIITDDPYLLTVGRKVLPGNIILKVVGQDHYETFSYWINNNIPTGNIMPVKLRIQAYYGGFEFKRFDLEVDLADLKAGHLLHYGVGPANIRDYINAGNLLSNNDSLQAILDGTWTHYRITTTADFGGYTDNTFFINESYAFNQDFKSSNFVFDAEYELISGQEKLRFAFINRYGVYDYFTAYGSLKRNSQIQRGTVDLPNVDYSSLSSLYSVSARGTKQYHFDETDNYSITTQPLAKEMANWVEQLFDSPEVYVQQGTEFVPINITNQDYQHNNSTVRNKDFNYTINFQPAKGREIYSEDTQPCLVVVPPKSITLGATTSDLEVSDVSLTLSGSVLNPKLYADRLELILSGSPDSEITSGSLLYFPDPNVNFSLDYQYINGPATASITSNIYIDDILQDTFYQTSILSNSGSYTFNFSSSLTAESIDNLTVSASFDQINALFLQSFRDSQVSLMCVNTDFLSLTSSQEVVQALEYGIVPQKSYNSTDYYYREEDNLQIGTLIRDSFGNVETGLSGYLAYGVEVRPADTLNRLKDKMWSIHTGSLLTISSGVITNIEDLSTITETLPLPLNVPVTDFTGSFKLTQDLPTYSGYDMTNKSSYNFNAYASFGATGYARYNADNTVDVLNYGPGPSVSFPNKDYLYRHLTQNSPQGTKKRTLSSYVGYTQCVTSDYGASFDVVEFPNSGSDPGFANVPILHWVWRGYQYPSDYNAAYEPPNVFGTYQDMCAYTGSFTNTLFISGAIEPGKEIFQGPSTTTTGVGQGDGFRTSTSTVGVTGSNDYFPILTPDGVKAVLYANPQDAPSSEILEIKNADGSAYSGSQVYRWEGPYFFRGALQDYTNASNASRGTTAVYVEPFRSLEFIDVGDTVYTSYDLQNNTYSSPLNGGNNWTKLYDYAGGLPNYHAVDPSINYVFQIDSNGVIVDRILSGSI